MAVLPDTVEHASLAVSMRPKKGWRQRPRVCQQVWKPFEFIQAGSERQAGDVTSIPATVRGSAAGIEQLEQLLGVQLQLRF